MKMLTIAIIGIQLLYQLAMAEPEPKPPGIPPYIDGK